jgi:hypothetical protein
VTHRYGSGPSPRHVRQRTPARERIAAAASGGHRSASSSACDGVFQPRVCRGRALSSAAM